ncbi:NUDIX domain-containing protein [Listeria aquatica]|uniref:NUDIX domain-containing protein n=1 Tax=Listeria aquatica TaxID=1494960 RepID=UPI003F6FE7D0
MSDEFVNNEEALKDYQANAFRTPDGYTSDILLFAMKEKKLHVLLIKRSQTNAEGHPNVEGGKWAVPGGFVNPDEDAYQAGVRELEEETGLTGITLTPFGVYDKPGRDPRGWIISRAHYAFVPLEALVKRVAGDDAAQVDLIPVSEAFRLPLAFDHETILSDAMEKITRELLLSTKMSDFLPEFFSAKELYEAIATAAYRDALPPFEVFESYLVLLPFIERDETGRYSFNQAVNAHSIFF